MNKSLSIYKYINYLRSVIFISLSVVIIPIFRFHDDKQLLMNAISECNKNIIYNEPKHSGE